MGGAHSSQSISSASAAGAASRAEALSFFAALRAQISTADTASRSSDPASSRIAA